MRRAVVKALVSHSGRVFVTALLAAFLLVLALTPTVPVAAQEETTALPDNEAQTFTKGNDDSSDEPKQSVQESAQRADPNQAGEEQQAATRATGSLQGTDAFIVESADMTVGRIEISHADCDIGKGATVTVRDGSSDEAMFINGVARGDEITATIKASQNQVIINGIANEGLDAISGSSENDRNATVTSTTGITCDRDDDGGSGGGGGNGGGNGGGDNAGDGDDARTADELRNLSCEELLVLFRAGSSSSVQYGDAVALADADVRARIEVCLEQEIVKGTAADEDLPDTGGVSLLRLAVLGVVSAAAGLSVVRAGRREG